MRINDPSRYTQQCTRSPIHPTAAQKRATTHPPIHPSTQMPLDEALSREVAEKIKSKARKPFDNAHRAALQTQGALYVQGFVVYASKPYRLIEHAWLELEDKIIDPNLPHLNKKAADLSYFPAQNLRHDALRLLLRCHAGRQRLHPSL
jgi:hypothetical protein